MGPAENVRTDFDASDQSAMRTFFTLVLTLIGRSESAAATCSTDGDCIQNAWCDSGASGLCKCNSGYSSASGTNQDCAQDCPANSCDANADCAIVTTRPVPLCAPAKRD